MRPKLLAGLLCSGLLATLTAAPVAALTSTTSSISLYTTPSEVDLGYSVKFITSVAPKPTADVSITIVDDNDPSVSGTATYPANAPSATFVWTTIPRGVHAFRLHFPGTATLAPSISNAVTLTVNGPTTTTVDLVPLGGRSYRLAATVVPKPVSPATVAFSDQLGTLGSGDLDANGQASVDVTFDDVEVHRIRAYFPGSVGDSLKSSQSLPAIVKGLPSVTADAWNPTVVVGYDAGISACMSAQTGPLQVFTLTNKKPVLIGAEAAPEWAPHGDGAYAGCANFGVTTDRVGSVTFFARFPGTEDYQPAKSVPVTINVIADTSVDLSEYVISGTSIYPVTDGYRDTVTLTMSSNEPLTATTGAYNSSGILVRSLGTRTINGDAALSWNGRRSDGALLPAGAYSLRTTFADKWGNTKTSSVSTMLSLKRLVTYSKTYYRDGEDYSFYERDGQGLVSRAESQWSTGVYLDSGLDDSGYNQARTAYVFALPTGFTYTKVTFSVLGKNMMGRGTVGIWDGSWYDPEAQVNAGYAWSSVSSAASGHVIGGKTTGWVIANGYYDSLFDVRQVRLTAYYKVLQ